MTHGHPSDYLSAGALSYLIVTCKKETLKKEALLQVAYVLEERLPSSNSHKYMVKYRNIELAF
ncbi:hypothetical protein GJ688_16440 [Heliobacillus mobilis]|uniref:Uncharacterized protein n=1 Tax=Heliobacterium mobile TaxID=28064 RepID=A0A6I3SPC4_HELMO|nr:hypothetical protein [Heliobacterium mobile]